ncbi:prolyl oligopeptidase family serine peptidase [Candidatus Izimaplasma bacterium HR1]|uniref:alpha/beta hydrolase family protein n=1 Tax=Candidatus Izimoplasma sp. HR1 TaxID=1541959 RepID=UPI00130D73CF
MKLSLNSEILNAVPLNEYYQKDIKHKGLIFIQHGYQSNKEYGADYLALTLARMGYFVVSIDAYKHGERIEEPYLSKNEQGMLLEAPAVIRHTSIDIIKLHRIRYKERFPKFDLIGISMGAMIAYYTATKTDKIRNLIPVIGTPDFMYQANHNLTAAGIKVDEYLNEDAINYLERISPINKVSRMKYEKLLMLNGTIDEIVPVIPTVRFIEEYDPHNYEFKTYETGHDVHRKMQLDIFNYYK